MNRSRRTSDRRPDPGRLSSGALSGRSDEQLVDLVLGGSDDAFEALFDRHVADSLWYARGVLGSWGEAEEAVRHSFAAAHAYLAAQGRETEFRPWLQTILGNYCLSMLQARTTGRAESVGEGVVVDLGEWRLRRKLLGVTLPIAPGAALRDSVMAACGIGAGATTGGAPLIGGLLAKVAVVAVLAGGAGVAGDVASDRGAPAGAVTRPAAVERTLDEASASRGGAADRAREPKADTDGEPRQTPLKPDSAPRALGEELAQDRAPIEPSPPLEPSPSTGSDVASAPLFTPEATIEDAAVALPSPVQSTLRHVVDVVRTQVPPADDLSETRPLDSVELSQIGDDLGVTAVESPVDVRALLSAGTAVLPK